MWFEGLVRGRLELDALPSDYQGFSGVCWVGCRRFKRFGALRSSSPSSLGAPCSLSAWLMDRLGLKGEASVPSESLLLKEMNASWRWVLLFVDKLVCNAISHACYV